MTPDEQPARPVGNVPRRTALFRLALVSTVLTVLIGADALYMQSGHQAVDKTNNFQLTDAGTLFVAAGLLFVLTAKLFVLWNNARRTVR